MTPRPQRHTVDHATGSAAPMPDGARLGGKVRFVDAEAHADPRGTLTAYALARHGFAAVRAFTVVAPAGAVRGGHAHRAGRHVLLRIGGEIEVELRYRGDVERVTLAESSPALLIEPPVWAQQTYRGDGAALLVLCDTDYDPDDYLADPV